MNLSLREILGSVIVVLLGWTYPLPAQICVWNFETNVGGMDIFIGGIRCGSTDASGRLQISEELLRQYKLSLTPNKRYNVSFRKDGINYIATLEDGRPCTSVVYRVLTDDIRVSLTPASGDDGGVSGSQYSEELILGAILSILIVTLSTLVIRDRRKNRRRATGTHIGYYRDLRVLSNRGAMAKIYLATNEYAQRRCVLKIMREELLDDRDLVLKFLMEGEILQALYKNVHGDLPIIKCYNYGKIETRRKNFPFIELEYIPGIDLRDYLFSKHNHRLRISEFKVIMTQVVKALMVSHRQSVVHRDLKPEHIRLVNKDHGKIKVIDFGVAKIPSIRTITGSSMGTPAYMSPEQCKGGDVYESSDVYSLGVVFYQSLSGRVPFEANNPLELMAMHQNRLPAPLDSNVPEKLARLVMRMLEKHPQKRPSLIEVLEGLR